MKLTMLTAIALAGLIGTARAQQPVSWTDIHNVMVRGGSLEKTGGCDGCDDAGAVSQQLIRGDGSVEFTVGEDYSFWMAGLSRRDGNARFGNIDFGIRINGNGWADVVENGSYVGGDTDYRAGDTFRIEIMNDRVRYLRNGQVIFASKKRPAYPLAFDVSLGSMNATVRNARIDTRDSAVATSGYRDEFDQLDRNGDRRIARREWRGMGRNFNRLDLNRDGFISRYEFEGNNEGAVGTSGQFITVSGNQPWTSTGIFVRAGDTLRFQADCSIQMSTNGSDFAGPAGSGRQAYDAPMRNVSAGSLIARIGNSAPFVVGANRTVQRAPVSGELFLGVNDDYLDDNRGEYRVTVTVDPR